jgi:hypothetical protein
MGSLIFSYISFVWCLLIAATVLSWEMGHGFGFRNIQHTGMAIIVIAFIKVRYVILDFMEIRSAPLFIRLIFEAWIVIVCSTLLMLYLK